MGTAFGTKLMFHDGFQRDQCKPRDKLKNLY